MTEDYLMSVAEAAKRLDVDKHYVYSLIKQQFITPIRFRTLKISNSEINNFIEKYKGKNLADLNNVKDLKEEVS